MSQRKQKRKTGKQRNFQQKKETSEHPPQIDGYQIVHTQTMRFTATALANNTNITYTNLLDSLLVATSATTGVDLFDLVKIKSVRVWAQSALGTPASVACTFATATGDRETHQDTSLGVRPAFIHAKPSNKSLASFFQQSGFGTAFILTCPAGSIIDVKMCFKTGNGNPVALANALVGATTGEVYYRGLDGAASAGTNFPPPAGIQTQ